MSPRRMFRSRAGWTSAAAVLVVAGVLTGTMLASAAGPPLPQRTPAQLLVAMRDARPPGPMTAEITENANLGFPSLPDIPGLQSSVLSGASFITGTHTFDIWYRGPRQVRIAIPVSFGETDLRVNGNQVWLWDSHGQTATHYILPARPALRAQIRGLGLARPIGREIPATFRPLTPQQAASKFLAAIGPTTKVTVAGTTTVAGRPAYELAIAPRTSQSLISQIVIAVDSKTYLPLRLAVFARGTSAAAFSVGFTSLTFGTPAASNFTFTPPVGAHVKTEKLAASLPGMMGPLSMDGIPPPPGPFTAQRWLGGAPMASKAGWVKRVRWVKVAPTRVSIHYAPDRYAPMFSQTQAPGASPGVKVIGSGWLSVAVLPGGDLSSTRLVMPAGAAPAGQISALARILLNSAAPVHGRWGSGRLLRTNLLSVLVTNNGKILIGAVTPDVLYADAAKVK